MTKNDFAITPPMGWNSYDYYDTAVTEEQVKANADFMAKHLKAYGYEYIVVDIEWYSNDAATKRDKYQYIPFGDDEIDEYGRFIPSPTRFPSSKNGESFFLHSLHKSPSLSFIPPSKPIFSLHIQQFFLPNNPINFLLILISIYNE